MTSLDASVAASGLGWRHLCRTHERAIVGGAAVIAFLLLWEGFERGWWADLLRPLIGPAAERWQLKPIFISSPTRIAVAAWRMFFVTGEIWRDLAWSVGVALLLLVLVINRLAARQERTERDREENGLRH